MKTAKPTGRELVRRVKTLELALRRVEQEGPVIIGDLFGPIEKTTASEIIAATAARNGWGYTPQDIDKQLLAFSTSIWVMACVGAISSHLSRTRLIAERMAKDGTWEPAPTSELAGVLMTPRNGVPTREFVEMASMFLELTGITFVLAEREAPDLMTARGRLVGFRALRPTQVEIVPGGSWVKEYRFTVGALVYPINPENVGTGRYPDPNNDWWGVSPQSPLTTTLQIDSMVEQFNAALLSRGGVPQVVAETDKALSGGSARRMRADWDNLHGRPECAGGLFVADGGTKLRPLGVGPKDMEFSNTVVDTKRRVLGAFGVPPAIISDFSDASLLANAAMQERLFYTGTLVRKGGVIEAALNYPISLTFRGFRARFAWEEVEAMKPSRQEVLDETRKDYESGIITLNEARAERKLEPVSAGDEFKQPAAAPSPFGVIPGAKGGARIILRPQVTGEFKSMARAAHNRAATSWGRKHQEALRTFFSGEQDRVLANLAELRPPAKSASDDFADEDFLKGLFDTFEEADAYRAIVGPVFLATFIDAGESKGEQLAFNQKVIDALNETHAYTRATIDQWSATRVVQIQQTTMDDLRRDVSASFEAGESVHQLEERIRATFVRYGVGPAGTGDVETRIERIARTETNVALNEGGFAMNKVAKDAGAKIVKSWLSIRDFLVRDSHQEIDAETTGSPIALEAKFANGLLHPGDSDGEGSEVINCRCTLIETVLEFPDEERVR